MEDKESIKDHFPSAYKYNMFIRINSKDENSGLIPLDGGFGCYPLNAFKEGKPT